MLLPAVKILPMELREIKSLCALSDSGSLSQTARLVHLTPAAVHKQLKQLESELQIPLYERKQGRLRLTAAAELLIPYLRDILGQYETVLGALEEWKGVRRGVLRIGAGPSLATYLLPSMLRSFHKRFSSIDLDVQTGSSVQLLDSLRNGSLDMALVVAPDATEEPSLEIMLEHTTEIVIVTALPRVPARATVRPLHREPFLLFRKTTRIESLIDRYWAERKLVPNVIMRFDSAEALKATLKQGVGIAMLPLYTVEEDLRSGVLRRIRQKDKPLLMRIHLLTRGSSYVPPALMEFIATASRLTIAKKTASRQSSS